jgi:prepilin peptidase CpaA
MFGLSPGSTVLVLVAAVFTAVAAGWDLRTRRIPNKLTLPVFALGWVYQGMDRGWTGLADAGLGFLVGFGILFILWVVGGGGGGDVKLMGALSVWLGFRLTLLVMIVSTALVLLIGTTMLVWSAARRGVLKSRAAVRDARPAAATDAASRSRRVLPFAVPVALATWLVIAWKLPTLDNPVRGLRGPAAPAVEAGQ